MVGPVERFLERVPDSEAYAIRDGVWYASAWYENDIVSIECNRYGSLKYALNPIYDYPDALIQTSARGEIVDLFGTPEQVAILVYLAERCDDGLSVLFRVDHEVQRAKETEVYTKLADGTWDVATAVREVRNRGRRKAPASTERVRDESEDAGTESRS